MQSQVFSGARAFLQIGRETVGYCLAMSGTTAINYQPIEVIGSLAVIEHVPTGYTVEMTAQLSRLSAFTRLAKSTGINVAEGSAQAVVGTSPQIMPAYGNDGLAILETGELVANIQDVILKKTIYKIKGVKASQKAFDIGARAPVAENVTFVARIMSELDEGDQAVGI